MNPPRRVCGDFPYFRRLWRTTVARLLAAALLPPVLLAGGILFAAQAVDSAESLARMRTAALAAAFLGGAFSAWVVVRAVTRLVHRLETLRRENGALFRQLRHAHRRASAGRLAEGALEEMTDSLANIASAGQWLRALWAERERKEADPEEAIETLEQIDAEVHRSARLLRRGLELARPARGPVCIEFHVNDLLTELLQLMRRELFFKRIRVRREPGEPEVRIAGDPDDLRQVLQNLIENAAAASPVDGEIAIAMAIRGDRLCVTVRDSGPGIPQDRLETIFEPFAAGRPEGLGLGLTISRTIVERMGGRLEAANSPAGGAAFTVEIPLRGPGCR